MYLSGINYESFADGLGVRTVIFVSGCLHNCYNCHSKRTHSFTYGKCVTDKLICDINAEIDKREYLSGITLSGGDCMYSPLETIELIKKIHIPQNNIWCYTGFAFDEITKDKNKFELLKYIDVLVDGVYIDKQRDITLKFRGSSNQRIINVKKSLDSGAVVLLNI